MKTTKEKIKVMQHWADGGDIEWCHRSGERWATIPNSGIDPNWNWTDINYRIKEKEHRRGRNPHS